METVKKSAVRFKKASQSRWRSDWICPRCSLAQSRRAFSTAVGKLGKSENNSDTRIASDDDDNGAIASTRQPKPPSKLYRGPGAKRFFSLIQPTGIPHLGNYLGALRTWKEIQDEKAATDQRRRPNHSIFFGLADLHSLTLPQAAEERVSNIRQTFASLLAIGLHPDSSNVFVQSHVPHHLELMWYLSTVASMGYLSRMTQWKDKIGVTSDASMESLDAKSREKLKLSLFSYPVLQAADILLYRSEVVPVGEDQQQHVELARSLARSFNSAYAPDRAHPLLTVPEARISPAKRVMSLQSPEKKMSKSDPDPASRILISDSSDTIMRKIQRAKTDSVPGPITYDPETRPGVSNLLDILRHTTRQSAMSPHAFALQFSDRSLGDLKKMTGEAVVRELGPIQQRYDELMAPDNRAVDVAMVRGRTAAMALAGTVLKSIRQAMGLVSTPSVSRGDVNLHHSVS